MNPYDSFKFRSVTQDDINDVLNVYRQCEDFLALGPEPRASLEMVLKDLEVSRQEGGIFCGIYDAGGRMIGVVDFVPSGFDGKSHVAFISLLMIAPPFRRQGIGTEIVQLLEGDFRKNSRVTEILSAVQVNNPHALRFWQRNGYRIVGGPALRPDQTTVFHLQKACRQETQGIERDLRTWGNAPFKVAVIHGGPGAGGEMAPVARELSPRWGILEPIQTATSLEGQVEELRKVLEDHGDCPVTLVGFSWGAWLSFIVAARHPAIIRKLILVSSGPFEEKYVAQLQETRKSRLSEKERGALNSAIQALSNPATEGKDEAMGTLRVLTLKTDEYDPIPDRPDESVSVGNSGDIFQSVWKDAAELRRSGKLLELGTHIRCLVVAIHGDYDPHPAEGVQSPLSTLIKTFRFHLLKNCGHTPWHERQAQGEFFKVLKDELR